MSPWPHRLAVVVPTPAHSTISTPLTYGSEFALPAGTLVRVPLGKREVLGIVWGQVPAGAEASYVNGPAFPADGGLTASMPFAGKLRR